MSATAMSEGPGNEASQPLDFIVSSSNSALFSVQPQISAAGTLSYTPAPNANGSATINVRLHDNGGVSNGGVDSSAAQNFTISITPVNDAPIAVNQSATTDQNKAVSGTLQATDIDNDALTYAVATPASHGTATISSSGAFTYTPAAGYNGSDSFAFKASDAGGLSGTGTVSLTIKPLPLPDLVVTALSWSPSSPAVGSQIVFTATIKNQGDAATPAGTSFGASFFVDGTKVSWTSVSASNLTAGASLNLTASTGPTGVNYWNATSGSHTAQGWVDWSNFVAEKNENNNTLDKILAVATVQSAKADAYVRSGNYAATNFGSSASLVVKTDDDSVSNNHRRTYLQFDLKDLSVSKARLRLYGSYSLSGSASASVFPVADSTWVESTLNWNTSPAAGSAALGSVALFSSPGWVELDISNYAKSEKAAGRNLISLCVVDDMASANSDLITFNSREATENQPQLIVTP